MAGLGKKLTELMAALAGKSSARKADEELSVAGDYGYRYEVCPFRVHFFLLLPRWFFYSLFSPSLVPRILLTMFGFLGL